jgi:hypothetical protein
LKKRLSKEQPILNLTSEGLASSSRKKFEQRSVKFCEYFQKLSYFASASLANIANLSRSVEYWIN